MAIDPKRVKEIFLEAAELSDEAARAAYLDRACGGDAGLRARVEALLHSHEPEGSFLGTPAAVAPDPDPAATEALTGNPDPVEAATRTTGGENGSSEDEPLSFLAPSTRPDSLGRIGHYEVLQVLGRGGFGIVFRAFDEVLQRVVALKVMAPQLAATSPARKRFLREARSSAQVRHENVVQVYEVAEQPLPYLAMEFIPGETLQQRLDRIGPVEPAEVLRIGRQIAEGLAAAHATDLVHRDIKPGNILLEGGQQKVKITDFGLARAADDASLSQSGIIAGTPMYMAPEQAKGETLDQRADLFSLGSVLYQMAAGRPPFRATGALAVLKRVAEDTPRPIREIIPETPQWVCDIIAKLHAKEPDDRYQSAREVADVLADCEAQLKANSKLKDYSRIPRSEPPRSGRRKWVVAALLLLPLLALTVSELAGVTHLLHKQPVVSPTPSPAPSPDGTESEGWVKLFNGKDLSRWKTHPDQPGQWKVEDGVLIGSAVPSYLYSEGGHFADFHLRIEARINNGGDSGIFLRTPFATRPGRGTDLRPAGGYEVELQENPTYLVKTGSVWDAETSGAPKSLWINNQASLTRPEEWFTLEIIAQGNHLVTKVNGTQTADCLDPRNHFTSGHIALQVFSPLTIVQFRKIEIKELAASPPAVPTKAADVLPFLAGNWRVERQDLDPKLPPDKASDTGGLTYDYVAGGTFLRGRGSFGEGSEGALFLHSFNPANNELRHWQAWNKRSADEPAPGLFNPDNHTLTWKHNIGNGVESIHQIDFIDPNTIRTRLFQQDANHTIIREMRMTFTRVKNPVATPSLPTDPNRPAEMKILDRLVGEWRNENTVTDISAPDKPKTETARVKAESVLAGRFIESIVTYEGANHSDYALAWYDGGAKGYRQWFFHSAGYFFEMTGTWDEATKTLTWNSPDKRLEGRWTFKGDDVREFRHLIKAADGKVVNEAAGVSRRTVSP